MPRFLQSFWWLSLILHLLFLLAIILAFRHPISDEKQKLPTHYVPSYLYKGAITPAMNRNMAKTTSQKSYANKRETNTVLKPQPSNSSQIKFAQNDTPRKSILTSSLEAIHSNQMQQILEHREEAEPILLIGDEHEIADPFIQMIGRALSANFIYPELEGRMGIKGRVLVEMTLHPEGNFDEVQIIKSSNNQDFDAAALYAVNKAPRVVGAERFLQKPKRFLIGFVFM